MKQDIIKIWKEVIENFNEENKCGFCWNFFAPLTEVDLNLVKKQNDCCCVNVFVVRNKSVDFSSNIAYNAINLPTAIDQINNDEFYDVYFLIESREGINNYNEKPNHPIEESRHVTIFNPLRKCITNDILTGICGIGFITGWSGQYIYDYQDQMYYGIKLSITQRIMSYE